MNVSPITMSKKAALKAFQEYQAAVRADRPNVRTVWKAEDVALMQAYKTSRARDGGDRSAGRDAAGGIEAL